MTARVFHKSTINLFSLPIFLLSTALALGNNFPPPPTATVIGSRYLEITAVAWKRDIAIEVISLFGPGGFGDMALYCIDLFVQGDGTLGPNPFYQSDQEWGTIIVGDEMLMPSVTYTVRAVDGVVGAGAAVVMLKMWPWGDVTGDGGVDQDDVDCIVDAFGGNYKCAGSFYGADLCGYGSGCLPPDGFINLYDILCILRAIQGTGFPCEPCME